MTEMGKSDNKVKVWNSMMSIPGDEFAYEINRAASTIARDGLGRGFSVEAMDTLVQHMVSFIGTRIARYNDRTGVMPQALAIRIKVALNHADNEFNESLPPGEVMNIEVGKDGE